ncbi:MAG: hypothetical protein BRD44_01185 [Bacteroidetes bacterium QS_7_67_15]|nr:MAG: hypothetical protein BRD44_01185 [Bacteroidetes bacterium QS_7_67_15]
MLDAHVRDVVAAFGEGPAEAVLLAGQRRAAAAFLEEVLVELHPEAVQRLGRVVGVGDAHGPVEALGFGVERHIDFVVGRVLPVLRAGAAAGRAVRIGRRQVERGERGQVAGQVFRPVGSGPLLAVGLLGVRGGGGERRSQQGKEGGEAGKAEAHRRAGGGGESRAVGPKRAVTGYAAARS